VKQKVVEHVLQDWWWKKKSKQLMLARDEVYLKHERVKAWQRREWRRQLKICQVMGIIRFLTRPEVRNKLDEFFPPEPYPYPEDLVERMAKGGKKKKAKKSKSKKKMTTSSSSPPATPTAAAGEGGGGGVTAGANGEGAVEGGEEGGGGGGGGSNPSSPRRSPINRNAAGTRKIVQTVKLPPKDGSGVGSTTPIMIDPAFSDGDQRLSPRPIRSTTRSSVRTSMIPADGSNYNPPSPSNITTPPLSPSRQGSVRSSIAGPPKSPTRSSVTADQAAGEAEETSNRGSKRIDRSSVRNSGRIAPVP